MIQDATDTAVLGSLKMSLWDLSARAMSVSAVCAGSGCSHAGSAATDPAVATWIREVSFLRLVVGTQAPQLTSNRGCRPAFHAGVGDGIKSIKHLTEMNLICLEV